MDISSLQNGTYLAFYAVRYGGDNGQSNTYQSYLSLDGTEIVGSAVYHDAIYWGAFFSWFAPFKKTSSNSTLKLHIQKQGSTGANCQYRRMIVFRIN